jgi:hypothetical protein
VLYFCQINQLRIIIVLHDIKGIIKMINEDLRRSLIDLALTWESRYGVAPSIVSAISEYDAATKLVGMSDSDYSHYMQKHNRTAVSSGHDFSYKDIRYQIKAHRPSGKPGSKITNAGKASNYNWDILIWIRYDKDYKIEEAWSWERDNYIEAFDSAKRISPADMRKGRRIDNKKYEY